MKPGDLLTTQRGSSGTRLYLSPTCDTWDSLMKPGEVVVFLRIHPSTWRGEFLLEVLHTTGIRFVNEIDVELIPPAGENHHPSMIQ